MVERTEPAHKSSMPPPVGGKSRTIAAQPQATRKSQTMLQNEKSTCEVVVLVRRSSLNALNASPEAYSR